MSDYRDKYKLDPRPLGSGGQAQIFRAENRLTGDFVALKRRSGRSAIAADRLRREVDIQANLQHHNVMPILDFDADAFEWFAMPIAAESLGARDVPVSVEELKRVLSDAAT